MKQQHFAGVICAGVFSLGLATTADAALLGRLPATPGGTDYQAYYDDVLNVTWIADANLAASNTFGLAYNTDLGDHPDDGDAASYTEQILTNGKMTWGAALHWIDAMNSASYLGFNDWRLPTLGPVNGVAFDYSYVYDGSADRGYNTTAPDSAYPGSTASELAHLFYNTLGNTARYDVNKNQDTCFLLEPEFCLSNKGPFSNMQSTVYWTGLEYAPITSVVWMFDFHDGLQQSRSKFIVNNVWAVRTGDVSAVPVPAAVWFFGSGLIGLLGVARHGKA
ncbi:DUF1566 domain-containing protein [Thiohalobacter sp. IOR34]|uniref:Lcl domain-containing protein n=1 Tax=Thiohalobacter sp. IOR34 TaxID=3057176 RepID=UPI0025B030CF|nr:DUF1566 domain-containing protein [Thiohalobacter sp. IOR34]WJW75389.1 DUF1566 domain-containing protein [Thiohalobacter sp. IOR34]